MKGQNLSLQAVSIQDCIQFLKSDDFELTADSVYFKNKQFFNGNQEVW